MHPSRPPPPLLPSPSATTPAAAPPPPTVSSVPQSTTPTPPSSPPLPSLTPLPTAITPPVTRPRRVGADAALARGSVVQICGNNRTKPELVGKTGMVCTSQPLGGWHEVELPGNKIIRVQRNALTVLMAADGVAEKSVTRVDKVGKKKRKRKSTVNLGNLEKGSLKRYCVAYGLKMKDDWGKDQLLEAVKGHFEKTQVNEMDVIRDFLKLITTKTARHIGD